MNAIVSDFEGFLFDFDGLLVNSEPLHHLAYKKMLGNEGYDWEIDFTSYQLLANYSAPKALEQAIFSLYPSLADHQPWSYWRAKKEAIYSCLIAEMPLTMMPGAERFFLAALQSNKPVVVVTNSKKEHVEKIASFIPTLQQCKQWIYREDSPAPKPDPAPYQVAIKRYNLDCKKLIGFEDSAKGLQALIHAGISPVLVSEQKTTLPLFLHLTSFEELLPSLHHNK